MPQGTKLGPILFLIMINDLKLSFPASTYWKYVDDITISEVVPCNGNSEIQSELDIISSWATANDMTLNPDKCKEIIICFTRQQDLPPALNIEGIQLKQVHLNKVQYLVLLSNYI